MGNDTAVCENCFLSTAHVLTVRSLNLPIAPGPPPAPCRLTDAEAQAAAQLLGELRRFVSTLEDTVAAFSTGNWKEEEVSQGWRATVCSYMDTSGPSKKESLPGAAIRCVQSGLVHGVATLIAKECNVNVRARKPVHFPLKSAFFAPPEVEALQEDSVMRIMNVLHTDLTERAPSLLIVLLATSDRVGVGVRAAGRLRRKKALAAQLEEAQRNAVVTAASVLLKASWNELSHLAVLTLTSVIMPFTDTPCTGR
jgi:hypothetical protein